MTERKAMSSTKREFRVEAVADDGWIYKVHVFADDGGLAWKEAQQKVTSATRGGCGLLRMFSMEEGELTDLGWSRRS